MTRYDSETPMPDERIIYRHDLGDIVSAAGKTFAVVGRSRDARDGTPIYDLREWDGHRKGKRTFYIGEQSLDWEAAS